LGLLLVVSFLLFFSLFLVFSFVFFLLFLSFSHTSTHSCCLFLPAIIGNPKWENDYFPSYHPVLMVSVFFFGQVLAISMWSLVPQHDLAKILHVLFNLAAVACLIAGLRAIVDYEQYNNLPALTSMHSWLGVMTTTLFGMQIIGGFVLGAGTAGGADIGTMKPLAMMHRALGVITLAFTAVTILSGIQNQLLGPRGNNGVSFIGSCGFNVGGNSNDYPARYYNKIPDACRIAYGLGVTVMLSKLFLCDVLQVCLPSMSFRPQVLCLQD
jgi:hypothetical protein